MALRHPSEYPFNEGRLVSNKGLDIAVRDYDEHFVEEHVPHSNALHSVLKGRGAYLVGPMARYSLNFDRLPPLVQQAARDANLRRVCRNPFQSIVVRAVEVALRLRRSAADHRGVRAARAAARDARGPPKAPGSAAPKRRAASSFTGTG